MDHLLEGVILLVVAFHCLPRWFIDIVTLLSGVMIGGLGQGESLVELESVIAGVRKAIGWDVNVYVQGMDTPLQVYFTIFVPILGDMIFHLY